MSKPAAVEGSPAILSAPIIPAGLDGRGNSGKGWRSPRGPPCSALVRWHTWHERDVAILAHLQGGAPNQRPRLGAPKVSLGRAVMADAEHPRAQPAAGGDAEAVRTALSSAV